MKKPPLTTKHKLARLQLARNFHHFNKEWEKYVFSDEKKFNLDGPAGFKYYWHDLRKQPRLFSKRQSGGGSIMIWRAIGFKGKLDLVIIDTILNSAGYVDILNNHLKRGGY